MGTQFAIIYDIIIAAVFVAAIYRGWKNGFVGTVVGLAAVIAGLLLASALSSQLSELFYTSVLEKSFTAQIDEVLDESVDSLSLGELSGLDYSKVTVGGTPADEITLDYNGTNKAVVTLSDVDLSGTGIEDADLTLFGFDGTEDFSSMNGKTAQFTITEVEKYGMPKLVVAQVITVKLQTSGSLSDISEFVSAISNITSVLGNTGSEIVEGEASGIRSVVLVMLDTSSSVKSAILDNMIKPIFVTGITALLFFVIFIVTVAVIELIASALKIVNRIPVIGGINGFLGGCMGLVRGLIIAYVICVVVKFIISITGGEVMLLNATTINATYLFKYVYDFDPFSLFAL